MRDIRIVFMGTPDFAVGVLKKLIDEKQHIAGVITAPDRPAGRGRKLKYSAVKEYAISKSIPVLQPTNLKSETFLEELKALNATLQIIVAFRMLPKVVWAMPIYDTFNLHASLLPEYRGAAPINWAIINGETQTGVTTFFIDEKIDTGAILLKQAIKIRESETAGSLHDTLMQLGSKLVLQTIALIATDKAVPKQQLQSNTLKEAPKLTSENTRINWNQPSKTIDALIRGLSPYPVAWTTLKTNNKILKVKIYAGFVEEVVHSFTPGVLFANKKELKVATKDGYIYIKEIQLPGKKKMDIVSLLNGYTFDASAQML